MSATVPFAVTSRTLELVFRAAAAGGIARGRREAILARLEGFARDLAPGGDSLFAASFSAGEADKAAPATPRDIGETFWRDNFASGERRRLEGSFYTPVETVDRILDRVWPDLFPGGGPPTSGKSLCDPAMGCGFFPLRVIERLLAAPGVDRAAVRDWAAERLFGVDIDSGAVFMTRVFLWLTLSDRHGEFLPDPRHFRCGDSLLGLPFGATPASRAEAAVGLDWNAAFPEIAAEGGFDVIVGNPPYEVLTNFSRRPERRRLADAIRKTGFYRDALAGQINLYRCFVERSLDLLKPGGVLSFIVPLSLARDAAALPLRRRLVEEEGTGEWRLYGERDEVFPGVTQSACIFRAVRGAGAAERLAIASGGEAHEWRVDDLRKHTGGALALPVLRRGGARLLDWLWNNCPGRLGDVADMRVGEVDQTVYRDCMADADTGCLLVRGAHLRAFHLDVNPVPGKARFLDLPRFLAMKGATADACRERTGAWRVVQLGIRNMHTLPRLAAALVPPGVYVGNSLNVYQTLGVVSREYLAGVLNSRLLDWLFRVGSGNNNINLHEMRRLPFPAAPEPALADAVADAYRACVESAEARDRLDAAVAKCYGVPDDLLAGME